MTPNQKEQIEFLLPKIDDLDEAIKREEPEIEFYLHKVNDNLREFPELVHLLTDDQIEPIYNAIHQKEMERIGNKVKRKKNKAGTLEDGRSVADVLLNAL